MEGKSCLVLFKYKCNIKIREEILIIGWYESIGNWNAYDTSEKICKTDENLEWPQNTIIESKYIVFKDNNLIRWEELPNNRNRKFNP